MNSIIKFIKSEYNVIKLIFEIGIAGFSIYKILNWKNELTHIKKTWKPWKNTWNIIRNTRYL